MRPIHIPVARSIPCPVCEAPAGEHCTTAEGTEQTWSHQRRVIQATKERGSQ